MIKVQIKELLQESKEILIKIRLQESLQKVKVTWK